MSEGRRWGVSGAGCWGDGDRMYYKRVCYEHYQQRNHNSAYRATSGCAGLRPVWRAGLDGTYGVCCWVELSGAEPVLLAVSSWVGSRFFGLADFNDDRWTCTEPGGLVRTVWWSGVDWAYDVRCWVELPGSESVLLAVSAKLKKDPGACCCVGVGVGVGVVVVADVE